MSGFIVVAGLLTLATLASLLYPLLRRREGTPEAWRSAGIAGLLILFGAAVLYPTWSNFQWHVEQPGLDSPEAMVGRLARRLEKQPDDLDGWMMLGKSYYVIGQFDLSARAYHRAETLSGGTNAEALLGQGEALVEVEGRSLAGRAGRLFERAMEADPASVKALFYSAFAARERNELPLAKERFQRLLQANPPPQVVDIINRQMQEMDVQAQMAASAPSASAPAPAVLAEAAPSGDAAAGDVVRIPLRITMAASVAAKAAAGAPLFVLARVPGQRGPPLAAKRIEARLPLEVDLLSTDAMIAGSGFAAGQQLEIEARIANDGVNGGGAISRSGDPFGVIRVTAGEGGRAAVEINQLKP